VGNAGFDHLFALCHRLGFRFAPRIRDLSDHRLFGFEKSADYDGLQPLIGGRIHVQTVREHGDEVTRLIASLRQGSAGSSDPCSPGPGYQIRNCAAELAPGSTRAKRITR
jgi:TnpA family transposase